MKRVESENVTERFSPLGHVKLSQERKDAIWQQIQSQMITENEHPSAQDRRQTRLLRTLRHHPANRRWPALGRAVIGLSGAAGLVLAGVVGVTQVHKYEEANRQDNLGSSKDKGGTGEKGRGTKQVGPGTPAPSTLEGVQMFQNGHGWITLGGTLFHTSDDGRHWSGVAASRGITPNEFQVAVLNGDSAIVARYAPVSNARTSISIQSTSDGGRTWVKKNGPTIDVNHPEVPKTLQFVDSEHGWLATDQMDLGMGGTSPGALYRTEDGGIHWTRVAQSAQNGTLGFLWIQFADSSTGFTVVGKQKLGTDAGVIDAKTMYVSRTNNGGVTWRPVNMHLPTAGIYGYTFYPPELFGRHGVMVVLNRSTNQQTLMSYQTQDAGSTWQVVGAKTALNPIDTSVAFTFSSVYHGWLDFSGQFWDTTDGGRTWHAITHAIPRGVQSIWFANSSSGWVITNQNTLWHSADGGKTWKQTSP